MTREFSRPACRFLKHAALLVLAFLFAPLPVPAGEEVVLDGVLHVRNGATPDQGIETLHLREVWRAGGEDDEDILFGLVSEVGGDEEGNVYVLDAQLCQVHVYSPDGEFLRTLFREGEGPGEILRPRDLVMMTDGSVGAVQEFPGKIVLVDRQGDPRGSVMPGADDPTRGGFFNVVSATCAGGNLVLSGVHGGPEDQPGTQNRIYYLAGFSTEGKELVRYLETNTVVEFRNYVFSEKNDTPPFWWAAEVGPDGRVYTTPDRDRYAISVFAPDGRLERVIEREFQLWKRTPAEFERIDQLYRSALAQMNIPFTLEIEEYEPAISYWHRALHVAPDGALWVVSSRGNREQPDGIMLTYDVFDPAGNFTKQVAVACEGDGVDDALFFLANDQVVLVKGYIDALAAQFGRGTSFGGEDEELSVPEVICYRIE